MVGQQVKVSTEAKKYVAVPGNTSTIAVLESDWGRRQKCIRHCTFDSDIFHVPVDTLIVERIPITEVVEFVEIDKQSQKKFSSAVTRGFLGYGLFGLLGAAAGVVSMKSKDTVTFGVRLRDGRSFVGCSSPKVVGRLKSFMFSYKPNGDVKLMGEPKIVREDQTVKLAIIVTLLGVAFSAFAFAYVWYR